MHTVILFNFIPYWGIRLYIRSWTLAKTSEKKHFTPTSTHLLYPEPLCLYLSPLHRYDVAFLFYCWHSIMNSGALCKWRGLNPWKALSPTPWHTGPHMLRSIMMILGSSDNIRTSLTSDKWLINQGLCFAYYTLDRAANHCPSDCYYINHELDFDAYSISVPYSSRYLGGWREEDSLYKCLAAGATEALIQYHDFIRIWYDLFQCWFDSCFLCSLSIRKYSIIN